MPIPRSELVNQSEPGLYHCISRCVRRAYLCGDG
ncbi:MAG: Type I secretion system protein TolC, partial [Planctomycetota bacterium]